MMERTVKTTADPTLIIRIVLYVRSITEVGDLPHFSGSYTGYIRDMP